MTFEKWINRNFNMEFINDSEQGRLKQTWEASAFYENKKTNSRTISQRDYFTAMAMQGMLANSYSNNTKPLSVLSPQEIAECAIVQADAIIDLLET